MEKTLDIVQVINSVKMSKPEIHFEITCYHYEMRTRTTRYTDSDGNTHVTTETYEERVNTHYAR